MKRGKLAGLVLLIAMGVVLAVVGARWIHFRITHAVTNAVFVESDSLARVGYKRVAGRIVELYAEEGDSVRRGDPLAKLEDRDLRLKLEELIKKKERLLKEKSALIIRRSTSEEEIRKRMETAEIEAEAVLKEVEALTARIEQLKRDRSRLEKLYEKGVVPSRRFEEVSTELKVLEKRRSALEEKHRAVVKKREILEIRLKQLRELDRRVEALQKELEALERKERDLRNMIDETVLRSPIDGYVLKRYVSVGEVVRQGQFIYALYNPEDIYILVLLEETKLRGVKEGNRVLIEIDAFPDRKFEGVVEEIGKATAAKFALIPRDITAGEFTKVVQRIPLKVRITSGEKELLRVGMGGEVAIERSER